MTKVRNSRDKASFTSLIVFACILLAVLYALAPAPFARYAPVDDDDSFFEIYKTVFAPILWAAEHIPLIEKFYDWYFTLWFD